LWDGDDAIGLLGFADRLAVRVDSLYPGLQYANLAIRGKRIDHVLAEQVPRALSGGSPASTRRSGRPPKPSICLTANMIGHGPASGPPGVP
jgi:hypothetical protein